GRQVDVTARQRVRAEKCDQHHTRRGDDRDSKVIPFHRKQLSLLALITGAMHSSRGFKGKLTERWGRKASGLRDACAYDSGVAGSNVNVLQRRGPRACTSSSRSEERRVGKGG